MKQEIEQVYALADGGMALRELMEAIGKVLARHPEALQGITYSYRLQAEDTGYRMAFSLVNGRFSLLGAMEKVDVLVMGKEENLLRVLQRKLAPLTALLLGKIKVFGNKAALMKLAEFL